MGRRMAWVGSVHSFDLLNRMADGGLMATEVIGLLALMMTMVTTGVGVVVAVSSRLVKLEVKVDHIGRQVNNVTTDEKTLRQIVIESREDLISLKAERGS